MRVLLLAQKLVLPDGTVPPHGSGVHGAATLNGLRAHFEVLAVTMEVSADDGDAPPRAPRRCVPGWLRGLRQDLLAIRADRAFTRRALAQARSFAPDVVYARSEYFCLSGVRVGRALGVPVILEVNGLLADDIRSIYRSPLEPIGKRLERVKHRRAAAVVTVSPGLARRLQSVGLDPSKVAVVPNSVSPDRVREPSPPHGGPVVVGWVGHLMSWHLRALEWLIDVAPAVREAVPDVRFVVIGSGPGLEELIERVSKKGLAEVFEFTGSVPFSAVPECLARIDIGIVPEVFDYAFPVKLVDFGAAGVPVVAPRSESLDQQLAAGLEYEPFRSGDARELVAAVARLAHDLERRRGLGDALQRAVRERFTWTATGATLAAVVSRVTAAGRDGV